MHTDYSRSCGKRWRMRKRAREAAMLAGKRNGRRGQGSRRRWKIGRTDGCKKPTAGCWWRTPSLSLSLSVYSDEYKHILISIHMFRHSLDYLPRSCHCTFPLCFEKSTLLLFFIYSPNHNCIPPDYKWAPQWFFVHIWFYRQKCDLIRASCDFSRNLYRNSTSLRNRGCSTFMISLRISWKKNEMRFFFRHERNAMKIVLKRNRNVLVCLRSELSAIQLDCISRQFTTHARVTCEFVCIRGFYFATEEKK